MADDNIQIQGLEFEIKGNADKAATGLKNLTSTLKRIQSITKNGLGLSAVASDLKSFNDTVGNLDIFNITTMERAISKIGRSSRTLATVRGHLQAISELDFSQLNSAAEAMNALSAAAGKQPNQGSGGASGSTPSGNSDSGAKDSGVSESIGTFKKFADVLSTADWKLAAVRAALKAVGSVAKAVGSALWGAVKLGVKGVGKLASGLWGLTKQAGAGLAQRLISPFKKFGSAIKNVATGHSKLLAALGRVAFYRIVRSAIKAIGDAWKEGTNNLYEYSKLMGTQFHKSLNSIATDALYLKNSFAAAAAPLINALAPAIDFISDKIANLLNLLAQLFAKLSGKSVYSKAVKNATEYAKATGGAASKMKQFLASFDELNVMPDDNSGGGGSSDDYGSMFEEAVVNDKIASFGETIREMFKNGEWAQMGAYIAEILNEQINSIDFTSIGQSLGSKFTAVIQTAYGFMSNFDFAAAGKKVAGFINGAIEKIDWNTFGRLVQSKFTSVITFIGAGLGSLDWGSIGNAVGEYLRGSFDHLSEWLDSIDWNNVGQAMWRDLKNAVAGLDFAAIARSFFTLLGKGFAAIVTGIGSFFKGIWKDITDYFSKKTEECGGNATDGFFKGIKDGFNNVVDWIKKNIVDPFVEGFKSLFGIHSPSTVMKEIGGYVVEGFFGGVSAYRKFKETIKGWASSVVEWFTAGKDGKGLVENFKETASNVVGGFGEKIGNAYRTGKQKVTEWAGAVKGWFNGEDAGAVNSNTFGGYATSVISGFVGRLGNEYRSAKKVVVEFADNIKSWFSNPNGVSLISAFTNIGKNIIQGFIDGISSLWNTAMNKIKNFGKSIISKGKEGTEVHSPSRAFKEIGQFVVKGFNLGIEDMIPESYKVMNEWTSELQNHAPSMDLAVDTSVMDYYDSASFAKTISPSVISNQRITSVTDDDSFISALTSAMSDAVANVMIQDNMSIVLEMDGEPVYRKFVQRHNEGVRATGESPLLV